MTERGPIFVAGLERSGTSLIYSLLASHPNIAMTRRTNLWRYFHGRFGDLSHDDALEACLTTMRRYRRLMVIGTDFDRVRADLLAGERTYARLFALIEEQHAERLGKPRWGDKSLDTERHAADVLAAYPGARIIHMVRDPRDRFASSATRWEHRRGGVGAGTAEWLASVRLARTHAAHHPDQYLLLRYEDLVSEPGAVLRAVCRFVDEPWADEMFSMAGAPGFRVQGGNSSYGRREPGRISTDSIGRYREVLRPTQVAFIELYAGRRMAELGYALDHPRLALGGQLRFALGSLPLELARVAAWGARDVVRRVRGQRVPARRLADEGATA